MPYPNYSQITDGETFDGPNLQADLADMRGAINALPEGATQRHALGRFHFPCPAREDWSINFSATTPHTYTAPYPGWATAAGWSVVTSGSGTPLSLSTSGNINLDGTLNYGILIKANLHLISLTHSATISHKIYVYFAIQVIDSNGVVNHIRLSECYTEGEYPDDEPTMVSQADKHMDIPLEAFITADDMLGAGQFVSARVVCTVRDETGVAGTVTATLEEAYMSLVVYQADAL